MKILPSKRFSTALIFIFLILFILEKGENFIFFILVTATIAFALKELYDIFIGTGLKVDWYLGIFCGILISYLFYEGKLLRVLALLVFCLMCSSLLKLFSKNELRDNLLGTAVTITGLLYIAVFGGYLILIRNLENGLSYIYIFLIIIWGSDSGAYLIGTKWGKNKLLPAISPNKTLEGAIGGLITGVLGASIWWFLGICSVTHSLIFGTLITLAGMIGDLFESLIKRTVGVKDSGSLFPGHGGILDRIDSLLFAAPVWYYYIRFFLIK